MEIDAQKDYQSTFNLWLSKITITAGLKENNMKSAHFIFL